MKGLEGDYRSFQIVAKRLLVLSGLFASRMGDVSDIAVWKKRIVLSPDDIEAVESRKKWALRRTSRTVEGITQRPPYFLTNMVNQRD